MYFRTGQQDGRPHLSTILTNGLVTCAAAFQISRFSVSVSEIVVLSLLNVSLIAPHDELAAYCYVLLAPNFDFCQPKDTTVHIIADDFMPLHSMQTAGSNRRLNGQTNGSTRSLGVGRRSREVNGNDAYLYALRVAYLAYLLQPRARRTRTVPKPPLNRSVTSSSINDLMKDFGLVRDSKSTRFPHDFVKELEKRLRNILMGKERRPEYQDAAVKRTFAEFLNTLSEPSFKERMKQDRRVEDLVLIFFSNATRILQIGKPPDDDAVKRLVDRHVALFVRLLSLILKDKDWARDRPELASRLQILETKLLKHDEDLSAPTSSGTDTIEEEVPLTYDVKDMPLVQIVARIFGLRNTMVQSDLDKHRGAWTERAALQDLKTYQKNLTMGTKQTLRARDFDTYDAYEEWRKNEVPQLSQMILAIIGSNPELAKSTPGGNMPEFNPASKSPVNTDATYSDLSKALSSPDGSSSFTLDLPADMGTLNLDDHDDHDDLSESIYTFIPTDTRGMFRFVMLQALLYDINESAGSDSGAQSSGRILSKQSTELLNEIALRWRLPMFTRMILLLDIVKQKFVEGDIDLDKLDSAFNYVKQPIAEETKNKRASVIPNTSVLSERHKWTVDDFVLLQQILSGLFQALMRNLDEALMTCFDTKQSPLLIPILTVLDEHVQNDPNFNQPADFMEQFKAHVEQGLEEKAREIYTGFVDKEIPMEQETWECYHVMQLSTSVRKLCEKIQKRWRRNPEIMGINPLMILVRVVLPSFGQDSKAVVEQIIAAQVDDNQIPIQDGFDLYTELRGFRQIHNDALPGKEFPYSIEEMLQEFVWRWIRTTDEQVVGWVENAIKNDPFSVRTRDPDQIPDQDERHSNSIIDVFRSFKQIIDQVRKLEWEDELTYAKFMTALAKSISGGVTRYCDILDGMFSREMDRMTPEQLAAANASRQEKWMQYAKDTWNQEKRVEPFHFYRESFVKLNDILFAISQWDQLEADVNVDMCADIIRQHSPPTAQRQRKITNYVFTIKIVEAEDLKACDVSGYSDPYVVLTDEYKKRLFKSKIVYRNLNPRFDESVDISTQGPLNVIATVWDWDALGDHDYVGRTSIKLDPTHFGDFLPREYWLDLDPQGRMLVRVSMEGERDDIQFYFAKAFRALQRAQRDMTRKIADKLSAYINHCLSRRALRSLTQKGISISSVSSYFGRNRASVMPTAHPLSDEDVGHALEPLFAYFDANFAIMKQTLTDGAMTAVMTRLWKEVLVTIESLLVPPLSDKPSQQKPLTQQELDIVFKWLQFLFNFFHVVDEVTQEVIGVPVNILKSPKYFEIQNLNFFYFDTTEDLIRASERMASMLANNQQMSRSRLSAPPAIGQSSFGSGLLAAGSVPTQRRAKSIMMSRNLGTMKRAKEEKRKAAQAEPSDDMILRILRMRPEANNYLRDRSRQKERLAAAAAAEMIVRQSLASGGGRMTGPSVVRR